MTTIKPGPLNRNWIFMPTANNGGGQAAQIVAITNPGTSGAICTVKILDASGFLTTAQYNNIYIIPQPQFAQTGDRGALVSYTPTSGVNTNTVKYLHISREIFLTF